jgi:hypothetical protein
MGSHAYVTYAFRCAECSRRAELKREYPELEDEDIRQALAFAAALVDHKVLPLPQTRRNFCSIRASRVQLSFTSLTSISESTEYCLNSSGLSV